MDMEQKKVQLPREVAEALENIKAQKGNLDCYILWRASQPESAEDKNTNWNVLYEFVTKVGNNIFLLADALRYGYEVEPDEVDPEPETITVTITTEQQEKIKKFYCDRLAWAIKASDGWYSAYCGGFQHALTLVGIKIPGIPPKK
jgi:hypothetical protein